MEVASPRDVITAPIVIPAEAGIHAGLGRDETGVPTDFAIELPLRIDRFRATGAHFRLYHRPAQSFEYGGRMDPGLRWDDG